MPQVRTLTVPHMRAKMHRLQGEDLNSDEDVDDDEIYGIVTVVQRDVNGDYVKTHVGGSSNYITVTKADREKWLDLQPTGEWLQVNVPFNAQLQVNWYLLEEDSVFDDDLMEALDDLVKGIAEEVSEMPGVARARRIYKLITELVGKISGDDVLGENQEFFDLPQETKPMSYMSQFACRANQAHYTAEARLELSKPFKR